MKFKMDEAIEFEATEKEVREIRKGLKYLCKLVEQEDNNEKVYQYGQRNDSTSKKTNGK